jgi:hypothetical protein
VKTGYQGSCYRCGQVGHKSNEPWLCDGKQAGTGGQVAGPATIGGVWSISQVCVVNRHQALEGEAEKDGGSHEVFVDISQQPLGTDAQLAVGASKVKISKEQMSGEEEKMQNRSRSERKRNAKENWWRRQVIEEEERNSGGRHGEKKRIVVPEGHPQRSAGNHKVSGDAPRVEKMKEEEEEGKAKGISGNVFLKRQLDSETDQCRNSGFQRWRLGEEEVAAETVMINGVWEATEGE